MTGVGVPVTKGSVVLHVPDGQQYILICDITSHDAVLARPRTLPGPSRMLKVVDLARVPEDDAPPAPEQRDLASITDEEWLQNVQGKVDVVLEALRIRDQGGGRKAIQSLAQQHNLGTSTVYRLLNIYLSVGAAGFAQQDRPDKGRSRLHPDTEAIITYVLEDKVLRRKNVQPPACLDGQTLTQRVQQKARKQKEARLRFEGILNEVNAYCDLAVCPRPHPNTLRRRVMALNEVEVLRARGNKKAAQARRATRGKHEVLRPHDEWEMDHGKLDVIIVHRKTRRPIGRAWITVIIDVRTRVIVGWYVTLEAPGSLSATLALVRAILPKDDVIARYNLTHPFPVWGKPKVVHVDNAKEFCGHDLAKFCALYQITRRFRPAGRPNYGGHIERVIGTLMQGLKSLPGATSSNVREKGEYDAEGNALLDFSEVDEYMALLIEAYNNAVHSALHTTPLAKYHEEVFEGGVGAQPRIQGDDAELMRIHALPYREGSVQREGIVWHYVHYYSEALNSLVLDGKKYVIRRDPRDISRVYIWDPKAERYNVVPYRNYAHPAVSIWEWRAAVAEEKAKGVAVISEKNIFANVERRRQIVDGGLAKSAAARTEERRARNAQGAATEGPKRPKGTQPNPFETMDAADIPRFDNEVTR